MGENNIKVKKVFVIGLDGATFDVINPLIEKGKLPHLESLIKRGSSSRMISTIPPLTAPAWLALSTGLNPGKTGTYDFLKRKSIKSSELTTVSSDDFKGRAFWDFLSSNGKKITIVNYPMLFPPYEINGYMISGIGTSWHENITYPSGLKKEIAKWTNGSYKVILKLLDKYEDIDLFMKDLYNMFDQRLKVVKKLMEREWDLFFAVFAATDRIQHLMWKHLDRNHPYYKENDSSKCKLIFEEFWAYVDRALGELIDSVPGNTNILIVSDHGFGSVVQTFNLPKWLVEKGYMKMKKKSATIKIPGKLKMKLKKLRYSRIRKFIPDKIFRLLYEKIVSTGFGKIDFEGSSAFTLPHSDIMGMIYLLDPSVKQKLIKDLENIGNDIGKETEVSFFLKENIYEGSEMGSLPDIFFTLDNWKTYFKHTSLGDTLYDPFPYSPRITGTHRPDGIFLGVGPNFKENANADKISIFDIAPTVLYLLGEKISSDMDGSVLSDFLVNMDREPGFFQPERKGFSDSEFDEDKVKQRLKDLGYFS